MSKKRKHRWWEKGFDLNSLDETDAELVKQFPNSVNQHQKNLWGKEDVPERYDRYGVDDWSRSLERKDEEYGFSYDKYKKTGEWRGYDYYRAPQLTYRYVQQIANGLAGQHNITIEVGSDWDVDLLNKKLKYNPASLIYGTKSELLATLLHEIGKLRFMESYTVLNSKYLSLYKATAAQAMLPFEEVRVDYQMLKDYESAAELYESALGSVEKQVKDYYKTDEIFRDMSVQILKDLFNQIVNTPDVQYYSLYDVVNRLGLSVHDKFTQDMELLKTFGTADVAEAERRIQKSANYYRDNGSLFAYCGDMTVVMYDLEIKNSGFGNVAQKVEASIPAVEPIKKEVLSQRVAERMDDEVFPLIEDLLKDVADKKEKFKEMFPGMDEGRAYALGQIFSQLFSQKIKGGGLAIQARGSGPTDSKVPQEWLSGEYKPLKDSMMSEIRTLVNRLNYLRREEQTIKFEVDQKRGKLNSKKLVKHIFGSRRLFKKKLPATDTIRSFAFSVLVDKSSSMAENNYKKIVHATRGMVLFNEVFSKLQIPYELVVFDNGATIVKGFEQTVTKEIEQNIGGLVRDASGGTNMDTGLEALKIKDRPEKNKIVIVLTDGGVGGNNMVKKLDEKFFSPWKKRNIKSLVFGLELSGQERIDIQSMNEGTGEVVDIASQLPIVFANLLKNLIRRK